MANEGEVFDEEVARFRLGGDGGEDEESKVSDGELRTENGGRGSGAVHSIQFQCPTLLAVCFDTDSDGQTQSTNDRPPDELTPAQAMPFPFSTRLPTIPPLLPPGIPRPTSSQNLPATPWRAPTSPSRPPSHILRFFFSLHGLKFRYLSLTIHRPTLRANFKAGFHRA